MADFLLTGEVGLLLHRSADRVRQLERAGVLKAVRVGGVRLFPRRAVERLVEQRSKREEARRAAAETAAR